MVLLIVLFLLLWLCSTATSYATPVAIAGCPDKCGNITVPYPFGMGGTNCYRDLYDVTCNHTYNPPKLFLAQGTVEVLEISLEGLLRVNGSIGYTCDDGRGSESSREHLSQVDLERRPYTFSDTRNRFTALGCDTIATIKGSNGRNFTSGCAMFCSNEESVTNGSCSGIGCCQTSIPKGFKKFNLELGSYENHTKTWNFSWCSYAFLVDHEWYNFSATDLSGFWSRNNGKVPLVLDWAIEGFRCGNASTSDPNYACGKNSECFNSSNSLGYLCKCSPGYQGNPYLKEGCQDRDECAHSEQNDCLHICTNTPGSYICSCPPGMEGDGRKYGSSCIAPVPPVRQPLLIKVALGVGLSVTLLLVGGYWLYQVLKKRWIKKLKENFFKRNGGLLLQQQILAEEGNVEKVKIFTAKELEIATDHYNENRILGQGGQGTVYKGMLSDGRIVAIKKSKLLDEIQLEQFINEVVLLSQINHRNVVKLLGCCLEAEIPLLVYEFISGGTLFNNIHNQNEDFSFSWDHRLRIATEVAGAIAYLHSAASMPIYHRDIKSSNILLDDKYRAKVSDFGTSRSIAIDKTHITTAVQGTLGYLDPEYFQSSQFTEKSDVYSFGVVLVELLTSEKPISSTRPQEGRNLITHFICSIQENRLFEIIDPQIVQEGQKDELKKVANLTKRCLHLNGKKRPTMKEVVVELEGLRMCEKNLVFQKTEEEVECYISETSSLWDTSSTSTRVRSSENTFRSPLDEQPLLFN
ncbi:PREDICTED: wall-associated receptor kinase 2-like [Nelumbo nucifera]|uniref:Wall-associated receptor kinase 2-like n=2 Tax=Nelumbo nucifera TaxID=4432 RepID=A0A822ZDI9_NELNU|nr:PREDICTED: wall-associated receptor kinase 2-like [Nelumbo nucifera]DAD42643.1 TPA_asm: hypothetical protein HUJ06_000873 [Nelumbo nucifera]